MAALCACCGKELPRYVPEPADPEVELFHESCLELRSAGARWARQMEGADLREYAAAIRRHGPGVVEVRAK